jgi:hypothetical protein
VQPLHELHATEPAVLCVPLLPLQKYIATASVAYQREIVRLYTALHKLDPSVKPPAMPRAGA